MGLSRRNPAAEFLCRFFWGGGGVGDNFWSPQGRRGGIIFAAAGTSKPNGTLFLCGETEFSASAPALRAFLGRYLICWAVSGGLPESVARQQQKLISGAEGNPLNFRGADDSGFLQNQIADGSRNLHYSVHLARSQILPSNQ